MKKLITLLLSVMLAVGCCIGFTACGGSKKDVKVGLICLHDENSTYDKNFIDAMILACAEMDADLVIKTGIAENNACYEAAIDMVNQGCSIIFADSFGHEEYMLKAAKEKPNVQFYHATGTTAHTANQANFHNAFADIYQGRFVAGYVAGIKLADMVKDSNEAIVKVGYVGAFPYAEVKSGYTSWFLGLRKAFAEDAPGKEVTMDVRFTNSWYDEAKEKEAANALIQGGCKIISQHADSWGAPTACEDARVPNVSYNGSTESKAPNTYLISSRINWEPYFKKMISAKRSNTVLPADWTDGFCIYNSDEGAVNLTKLGDKAVVAGTQARIEELIADIKFGYIKVFDCSTFTVTVIPGKDGKNQSATIDEDGHLVSYLADVDNHNYVHDVEAIVSEEDEYYFAESTLRSAPYFDVDIDGINILQ